MAKPGKSGTRIDWLKTKRRLHLAYRLRAVFGKMDDPKQVLSDPRWKQFCADFAVECGATADDWQKVHAQVVNYMLPDLKWKYVSGDHIVYMIDGLSAALTAGWYDNKAFAKEVWCSRSILDGLSMLLERVDPEPGDTVYALAEDGYEYPATFVKKQGAKYLINWWEGDYEELVERATVTHEELAKAISWRDGPGTVAAVDAATELDDVDAY